MRPRIARSRSYVFARAWGTVLQRDLQVAAVIGDVLAGRPVVYTTFLAYDEVAHHSGIERYDALAVLHDLDRQIKRIADACGDAPRPYRAWGYPWLPMVFVLGSGGFVVNTLLERPTESVVGLVLVLTGIPVYLYYRRSP